MNVFQRARESAVSEESSLRPRVRGSLAVMLERYCAEHRRCRGGAIRGHGRPESTTESRSSWPVRAAGRGRRSNRTCCPYRSTARLNRGQRSMVVREGAALERYRCLNPVIHAMPQIFSLSFTVSPRQYAARSRIARRVSSCSLALPQVNLFAWRVFEPKAAAGVSEPGALFYFVCHQAARRPCFPALPHVGSPRDRLRALPGVARWPASWESVSDAASRSGRGTW